VGAQNQLLVCLFLVRHFRGRRLCHVIFFIVRQGLLIDLLSRERFLIGLDRRCGLKCIFYLFDALVAAHLGGAVRARVALGGRPLGPPGLLGCAG